MKENPEWDIDLIMHGDTELCAPNGENLGSVRARVRETMNKIIDENNIHSILEIGTAIGYSTICFASNKNNNVF